MDEVRKNSRKIRDKVDENSLDWFEELYASANGDGYWIPWSNGLPHHFLVEWIKKSKVRGRALVVGCGLGEDAVYLSQQGWNVTAFDISPSAINWARKNYPLENIDWQVADLLSLPGHWKGLFDLVVEVHILQAIPESLRIIAAPNMPPLLASSGHLVCIGRLNEKEEEYDGPPWPLSPDFIDSIGINLDKVDFMKGNISHDDPEVIRYRDIWKNEA